MESRDVQNISNNIPPQFNLKHNLTSLHGNTSYTHLKQKKYLFTLSLLVVFDFACWITDHLLRIMYFYLVTPYPLAALQVANLIFLVILLTDLLFSPSLMILARCSCCFICKHKRRIQTIFKENFKGDNMQAKREDKWYKNPYDDFVPHRDLQIVDIPNGKVHPQFLEKVRSAAGSLLEKLELDVHKGNPENLSVYTGMTGIAMLYCLIAAHENDEVYIRKAMDIVEKALRNLKQRERDITFLTGDCGPLALGAVLYYRQNNSNYQGLVNRLIDLVPRITSVPDNPESGIPDEILYGRAGFLHALLYVNKHIEPPPVSRDAIKQVVSSILDSGQRLAKVEKHRVPLMYKWHGKYYVGGAHGIAGILYTLLQVKDYLSDIELNTLIKPTMDYLQGLKFSSNNFPSSIGNNSDRLVQWCHGAPGVVQLFGEAYKVFKDEQYMHTALQCGDIVWQRGITTKGYSICHGVAGNAYTFLYLYQLTQDLKHLHRACQFADWCFSYGKYEDHKPDRPLSLFEGIAGAIYFLFDIQKPMESKFPGFTL